MFIKGAYFFCISSILLCSGCANMTTISRSTEFPSGGLAVHLDAQQRLVYARQDGFVCAEPSPDAIQAVSASLAGSLDVSGKGSAALAQALQQSTAGIGLRTQSITLMRDALYRICEAAHNRQLNSRDVVQLLERSQDLSLGVLAIEQLTGAVAARQPLLASNANSGAAANVTNTQAQLDNAQTTEAQKKKAADDAQKQLDADNDKLKADQAINPPTDASKKEIDDLTKNKIPADQSALSSARDDYQKAQAATKAIQQNLNAAITSANATAAGGGGFSEGPTSGDSTINKDTAVAVSAAVTTIVTTIVKKGHLTDACISFLSTNPDPGAAVAAIMADKTMTDATKAAAANDLKSTFQLCQEIIKADLATAGSGNGPFLFDVLQ